MAGQPMLKQLRAEVKRLRIQNNALRIVVQGVHDYYDCDNEGEQPEDTHGDRWEECFRCQSRMALERPEQFRMQPERFRMPPATLPGRAGKP